MTELHLPHLGEGVTEGRIRRWLKREGEYVRLDEPIVEVETDKVTTELPSPVAGMLTKILAAEEELVAIGTTICKLLPDPERLDEPPLGSVGGSTQIVRDAEQQTKPTATASAGRPTPAVRTLAAQNGIALAEVTGTGPHGRITLDDVRRRIEPPSPALSAETPGATIKRVSSKDGTELGLTVSGTGPPLLLVHGIAADHSVWGSIAGALCDHFTVYAVDRRGRGLSTDKSSYSLEQECDDLIAALLAIGEPTDVVAHSYGALVALEAAGRLPLIRKLVLYEPPLGASLPIMNSSAEKGLQQLLTEGKLEDVLIRFLSDGLGQARTEIESQRHAVTWAARVATAHTICRELAAIDHFSFRPANFESLPFPIMLLIGEHSRLGVASAAHQLAAALPLSWIAVLPGQTHLGMITAPKLLAGRILNFLT